MLGFMGVGAQTIRFDPIHPTDGIKDERTFVGWSPPFHPTKQRLRQWWKHKTRAFFTLKR